MTLVQKLMIFPIIFVVFFLGTFFVLYFENALALKSVEKEFQRSSGTVLEVYQASIGALMDLIESISLDPMLGPEPEELNTILFKLRKYKAVESAFFLDMDENVLASGEDRDENPLLGEVLPQEFHLEVDINSDIFQVDDKQLLYSKRFEDQGDPLGRLQIVFSLQEIRNLEERMLTQITQISTKQQSRSFNIMIGVVILIVFAIVIFLLFLKFKVVNPLKYALKISNQVSEGDLSIDIRVNSNDEIGQLLTGMNKMAIQVNETITRIVLLISNLIQASQELSDLSNHMRHEGELIKERVSSSFDVSQQVSANMNSVAAGAEEVATSTTIVSESIASLSVDMGLVADTSQVSYTNMIEVNHTIDQISKDMDEILSSVASMSLSVSNVSEDTQNAMKQSNHANENSQQTLQVMNQLQEKANNIGRVVKLIGSVATQTNMLALNATIEAAKAGEYGKGFAVVALEVQNLAQQTSEATEEITQEIEQIQQYTLKALQYTETVSNAVNIVSQINRNIAQSMDQESTNALNINQSVENIAQGSRDSVIKVQKETINLQEITHSMNQSSETAKESTRNMQESAQGVKSIARSNAEMVLGVQEFNTSIQKIKEALDVVDKDLEKTETHANGLLNLAQLLKESITFFKLKTLDHSSEEASQEQQYN